MAAPKPRVRMVALLAPAALALAVGCYSTTPHRAEVASNVAADSCANAITDVFSRSGFVQLPTPPKLSMLFAVRLAGPYTSFMRSGAGVGVTIARAGERTSACHVTLEALSPDVTCPEAFSPLSCNGGDGVVSMNSVTGDAFRSSGSSAPSGLSACPTTATFMCDLSYAPGAENDAAIDELARRLQEALGARARVD